MFICICISFILLVITPMLMSMVITKLNKVRIGQNYFLGTIIYNFIIPFLVKILSGISIIVLWREERYDVKNPIFAFCFFFKFLLSF